MFCEKCGAQLPDTAGFCNKCGNAVRKKVNTVQTPMMKVPNVTIGQKKSFSTSKKNDKESPKSLARTLLLVIFIIIVAAIVIAVVTKETSIYGTWTDAGNTMTFTFSKDGNLRISGANNVLGADAFQFTKEDGIIHLQAQGGLADMVSVDLPYELTKESLTVTILNQRIVLYRTGESVAMDATSEDSENSDESGGFVDSVKGFAEEAMDTVQIVALYGTWTDSYGAVSFTFNEDGTIYITGLADTLGVEAFTFTEVDDDTLQLKADSDNAIIGAVGLNMDYEIEGDTMTVTIAGKELELVKKE